MPLALAETASCRGAWVKRLIRRWAMLHPGEALRLIALGDRKVDDPAFLRLMSNAKKAALRMIYSER